jgi:hypothetical protein
MYHIDKQSTFTIVFAIGALILIIGLVLSYYPNTVISGIEGKLQYSDLPQETKFMYQGSLNWWHIEQLTVYQPVSYLSIVTGAIMMAYAVLSRVFSIVTRPVQKVDCTKS